MKPFIWTSASRTHKRRIEGPSADLKLRIQCVEEMCWSKVWATLANRFSSRQVKSGMNQILHKVYKSLIRGTDVSWSDFNKPNVFRFPKKCWNKVWATFVSIIVYQDKWNQVPMKSSSPKSRKYWSKANTSQVAITQMVFASLRCAETKYELL